MKGDLALGGTNLLTGGGSKRAGGGHVPPSLYIKRGPVYSEKTKVSFKFSKNYLLNKKRYAFLSFLIEMKELKR